MTTWLSASPTPRRVFAALAAALTSTFTLLALATKPTPPPPPSSFEHPAVQFLEPKPGAKLANVASVKLALGAVDQITRMEFGLAGKVSGIAYVSADLLLNTRDLPNGRSAIVARATYKSGQVIEARVPIEIYNPSHRLKLIDPITRTARGGALTILELTYTEPVRIEVDFGDLDSAFDRARVKVADVGGGVYRVSYPVSAGNQRPEGRRRVVFRARNARGEVMEDAFELELRKNPLLPIVVSRCIYTPKSIGAAAALRADRSTGAMLVDRIGEPDPHVQVTTGAPDTLAYGLEIKALPDLVLGRTNHARLLWKAPRKRDARRPAEPRLVIKARGYAGYYLCWIPEGVTSGHLELALPEPGTYGTNLAADDGVPGEVELMVALDTNDLTTEWVSHRFTIRPAGWRGPLTPDEAARPRKVKVKRTSP